MSEELQNELQEELQELYNVFVNNKLNEECEYKNKYENMFTLFKTDKKIIEKVCKEDDAYLKATVIDACYSTQVRRFDNLTTICEELKEHEAKSCEPNKINEIVNNIQKNAKKSCFSFLTKYFALHRRYDENYEKLPIYDKYVQEYINAFYSVNKNKKEKFKDTDKKAENAYEKFYSCMKKISEKEKLDFDKLDNKIWFCGKLIQLIVANNEIPKDYQFEIKLHNDYQAKYFNKILKQEINKKIKTEKGLQ